MESQTGRAGALGRQIRSETVKNVTELYLISSSARIPYSEFLLAEYQTPGP